jgi:lipoprotein-anchoring transpeptidase ErfK/SrfK
MPQAPATPAPQPLPEPAPHPAAKPSPAESEVTRAARLQTVLARSGFSPGLIDGKPGRKTKIAIEHFQAARGLTVSGTADEPTMEALKAASGLETAAGGVWTRKYKVTAADLALLTGPVPTDWNERALLERSGYADLQELLAERGWCSADFVASLNPGVEFAGLAAGDEVTLPDVPDAWNPKAKALPKLARLEVNLAEKLVQGFDESGTQVLLLHCSIAKAQEKRPVGELKVKVVATDPEYTFDPKDWPEVDNVTTRLRIAPGPRNPVGSAWIGLDKPGYGMHGTVRPQDIGKTGSHGCFRLANWDALRLARAVKIGMVVEVKE